MTAERQPATGAELLADLVAPPERIERHALPGGLCAIYVLRPAAAEPSRSRPGPIRAARADDPPAPPRPPRAPRPPDGGQPIPATRAG